MRKSALSVLMASFLIISSSQGNAAPTCPLEPIKPKEIRSIGSIKGLPVLQDGRVKPFDTFARNILLQFSGKGRINGEEPARWVLRLLLAPEMTIEDKVFLIDHPDIAQALGMELSAKRRYSFAQLETVYPKLHELAIKADSIERRSRNAMEEELIRVDANVQLFAELSHSFKFAMPHPDFAIESAETRKVLDLPGKRKDFSFLDIALQADFIRKATEVLETKNADTWTETERDIVRLLSNLYQWSSYYSGLPFHMLPAYEGNDGWLNPWDAIHAGFQREEGRNEISLLRDLVVAYYNGQQLEFDLAGKKVGRIDPIPRPRFGREGLKNHPY